MLRGASAVMSTSRAAESVGEAAAIAVAAPAEGRHMFGKKALWLAVAGHAPVAGDDGGAHSISLPQHDQEDALGSQGDRGEIDDGKARESKGKRSARLSLRLTEWQFESEMHKLMRRVVWYACGQHREQHRGGVTVMRVPKVNDMVWIFSTNVGVGCKNQREPSRPTTKARESYS